MAVVQSPNVPVTSYLEHIVCAYHFFAHTVKFPIVYTSGTAFTGSTILETSTGSVNAGAPSRLYDSSALFTPSHVGQFVSVRDPVNPSNSGIYVITGYISSTEVQLNNPVANFTVSGSNLAVRVFSASVPATAGDNFVVGNPVSTQPSWQCRITANLATTGLTYAVGPIGGFNTVTPGFSGPVSAARYGAAAVAQAFFLADATAGWALMWSEDTTAGAGANRVAVWFGTVSSIHAAGADGFPADGSYAGILGTTTTAPTQNLGRSTAANTLISNGDFGNTDGSGVIGGYLNRRLGLGSGLDPLAAVTLADGRSATFSDYDFILSHRSPKAIRGVIPGLRTVNDSVPNRTLLSSGATYVLGNGIACVWNGKPAV